MHCCWRVGGSGNSDRWKQVNKSSIRSSEKYCCNRGVLGMWEKRSVMLAMVMSRMGVNVDLVMRGKEDHTSPDWKHKATAAVGCRAEPFPRKRRLRCPRTLSSHGRRSSDTASHTSGGVLTIRCRNASAIAMPFAEESKRGPLFGISILRCEREGFHEEGPHRTSTCHPSITAHTERAPQRIRNKIQIVQRKGGIERLHLTSNDRRKDREKIRKHLIELDANWTNATGRKALNATRETIPRITNKSSPYTPWYCVSKSSELRRDRMTWKRLVMR